MAAKLKEKCTGGEKSSGGTDTAVSWYSLWRLCGNPGLKQLFDSQNCIGWEGPLGAASPMFLGKAGPVRAGCSWLCPIDFLVLSRLEVAHGFVLLPF